MFRVLAKRLTLALVIEATRALPARSVAVDTPLERTSGRLLAEELVAIPILRAGLGMLDAVAELFPWVSVGYIGLERDEATLRPVSYYEKLPEIEGRDVLLLDPMLATGGSAIAAAASILRRAPRSLSMVCVVAAPEGVAAVEGAHPGVSVFAAALDRGLDDRGFIRPGLGDFGDRLFGTAP